MKLLSDQVFDNHAVICKNTSFKVPFIQIRSVGAWGAVNDDLLPSSRDESRLQSLRSQNLPVIEEQGLYG